MNSRRVSAAERVYSLSRSRGIDAMAAVSPAAGYIRHMAVAAPPELLKTFLDGPHAAVRDRVRDWLADNPPRPALPLEEHREQVLARAKELAGRGETVAGYPREYGGADDLGGYVSGFEKLAFGDLSLLVKVGVQVGLVGGRELRLRPEKHHDAYLGDIASLELPGCFAMTEDGHGSDVQHIRTTATYEDGGFMIHTPEDAAHK